MKKKIILILGILAILLIIIVPFFKKEKKVEFIDSGSTISNLEDNYVVEIKGEVNKPGLYIVRSNSRICDVIELAQGFTKNADTSNINLASKVSDGMQIVVSSYNGVKDGKVSINDASVAELITIPGIGEIKANAIVNYREKNGRFNNLEDLKKVSGISESLFEQIKDYITL